ncbi:uncharacterized protein LOC130448264 isoform X1 [Diorhabda sublineata]|uniref:uncharacterized protein LOC130448264 isoform X1 n=1 Tax=Diorhabda sublineata TaxID=1163346 RepID=UPI0024E103F8|nr:uncharacterized protein LOC130448264 isoform X1 [Diorhabda sublineata]
MLGYPCLRQYRLFHRTFRLYRQCVPKATAYKLKKLTKLNLLTGVQICCMATTVMDKKLETINLEEDISTALQEGDAAIIKLMNQLKDFVIVVSEEYRKCLLKQIEIIQRATEGGPLSEKWDELPQYRALASELLNELTEYRKMINILDSLARDRSSVTVATNNIFGQFVEIQEFIQKEVDQNKKIEKELLKLLTESIINEVTEADA